MTRHECSFWRARTGACSARPSYGVGHARRWALYTSYGLETSVLGALTPNVMRTAGRAMSAGVRMTGRPEGPPMRIPGDYLIDAQGVIRKIHRGKDIADHIPFDVVDRELRAIGV